MATKSYIYVPKASSRDLKDVGTLTHCRNQDNLKGYRVENQAQVVRGRYRALEMKEAPIILLNHYYAFILPTHQFLRIAMGY